MKKLVPFLVVSLLVVGCESTVDKRKNACADASISFDKTSIEKAFGKSLTREQINKACVFYK